MQRSGQTIGVFICLMLLCVTAIAGRAQTRMNDKDVEKMMDNLKEDAKKFRSSFDSAVGKSTIRKTDEEKRAKGLVEKFQKQTEQMLSQFKSTKKADTSLPVVQDSANQIDEILQKTPMGTEVSGHWEHVRAELATISEAFGGGH